MRQKENEIKSTEFALQAHLAQYDAVRNEIILLTSLQNQLINYSIAIIAGSITLFTLGQPPLINREPFISLIASLLMTALSWAFIEAELRIHERSRYLEDIISSKVQRLIGNENIWEYTVLKWGFVDAHIRSFHVILRMIASMGKFTIAYVPSVVFIIVFCSLRPIGATTWTSAETILFWVSVVMVSLLTVSMLSNLVFVIGYYRFFGSKEKKQANTKPKR